MFDEALQPKGFGKTRSWRVYVAMKLNLPRRGKRRLPDRIREPLEVPGQAIHKRNPARGGVSGNNGCGWVS